MRGEGRGGFGRGESEGLEGGGGGVGIVGGEDYVAGEGGEVGQPAQSVDVCVVWEFVELRGGGGELHCRVKILG